MITSNSPAGLTSTSTSRARFALRSEETWGPVWPTYHHHAFASEPVFETITAVKPPEGSASSDTSRALFAPSADETCAAVAPKYHHHARAAEPVFETMITLNVPS